MKVKNPKPPSHVHPDAMPLLSAIDFDLDLLPGKEGVYLVGGTTRDLLLGKTPADYDIAVSRQPEKFAEKTAARCGSRVIPMGRPGKMSFRVPVGGTILDITGLNGSTIRRDLQRRDFTINAMAIELSSARLLDCTGGRQDLAKKEVRMVSDGAFREDPVRLLRAFRLAAALGFSVEADTLSTIRRDPGELKRSAGERIRSELHQLLCCRNAAPMVVLMADSGLFEAIFQAPAPTPSQSDNFPTIFRRLEKYLNAPPAVFTPKIMGTAPPTPEPGPWLKFASLLIRQHRDVPEHESVSAIERICRRLRLSTRERNVIATIARHHTRSLQLYNAGNLGTLAPRDITRFFMDTGPLAPYLLLYSLAETPDDTDRIPPGKKTSFTDFAHRMLRHYHETFLPQKALPPFVTGQDLSSRFSLSPSPLYKKILRHLEEARLSGETATRQAAFAMTEKLINDENTTSDR